MALKIKVLKAPAKDGDCGGAEYQVRWVLAAGDTGWVIQRIDWMHDVQKCDGTGDGAVNGKKSCSGSDIPQFWEAWRVENGKVFVGNTNQEHQSDTYRTLDHPSRKKKHSILGKVQFIAGYKLTIGTGPDDWQENDIPPAGALPTRKTSPKGWSAGASRTHDLAVEWDCCANPPKTPKVTGEPTASDPGSGETVRRTVPLDASTPALRVSRLIASAPGWSDVGRNANLRTRLMDRWERIDALRTDVVRGGIESFIDQSKRERSYSLEAQSKLFLLNRYLFKLPRSARLGTIPFFGGWDIPHGARKFNPNWPFKLAKDGTPTLEGAFGGYLGDEYLALEEFDHFRKFYGRRRTIE